MDLTEAQTELEVAKVLAEDKKDKYYEALAAKTMASKALRENKTAATTAQAWQAGQDYAAAALALGEANRAVKQAKELVRSLSPASGSGYTKMTTEERFARHKDYEWYKEKDRQIAYYTTALANDFAKNPFFARRWREAKAIVEALTPGDRIPFCLRFDDINKEWGEYYAKMHYPYRPDGKGGYEPNPDYQGPAPADE